MTWNPFGKDWRAVLRSVREGNTKNLREGLYRYWYRWRPPDGVKVVEEDWDVLVVLDACRADALERKHAELDWLDGEFQTKTSRGSTSVEWLNRNFTDHYGDLIYLTANPFVSPEPSPHGAHYRRKPFLSDEHFHHVEPIYLEDDAQEGNTTRPEAVTERAVEMRERFPHKRLIVHYMQPHEPYIGEPAAPESDLRDLRAEGKTWDEIRAYYMGNLDRVLGSVKDLLERMDGRFVLTADHGELLGEHGMHTHPHGIYVKELVEVPWLVNERGERPEIRGEDTGGIDI